MPLMTANAKHFRAIRDLELGGVQALNIGPMAWRELDRYCFGQ